MRQGMRGAAAGSAAGVTTHGDVRDVGTAAFQAQASGKGLRIKRWILHIVVCGDCVRAVRRPHLWCGACDRRGCGSWGS